MEGHAPGQHAETPWYVADGQHGERLLAQGDVDAAIAIFTRMLERLGEAPGFVRAVTLGQLGRCFSSRGAPDRAAQLARDALHVVAQLPPTDGVQRLAATLRSSLGDALRASGQHDEARRAYEAALKIAEQLGDARAQGVDSSHLGALAAIAGHLDEALRRHHAALALFQQIGEADLEAAAWHQLGRLYHQQGRSAEAERHYGEAIRLNQHRGHVSAAADTMRQLAALVASHPANLSHARRLAEEALIVAQNVDPWAAGHWDGYGLLADIIDKQAAEAADGTEQATLAGHARVHRQLRGHGAVVAAALGRIGRSPSRGRAVLLRELGRCFHLGGRTDLAIARYQDAVDIIERIARDEGARALAAALHADLGDLLETAGRHAEAVTSYDLALAIAAETGDLRGQAHASRRLGKTWRRPADRVGVSVVTLYHDSTTGYVFDPDRLIDGPHERRVVEWTADAGVLSADIRPLLSPCVRTWIDRDGVIHFDRPHAEPLVEPHPECLVIRTIRPEVTVSGSAPVVWSLVEAMNGERSIAEILSCLPADQVAAAGVVLAALVATGVVDMSGRTLGAFVHTATKKGVLPAGGLESDAVLHLATDGNYRAYPGATRVALSDAVPDRLLAFHALTRARRSRRDYAGTAIARADLDALLHTACGVTGVLQWEGRTVDLRAYPASGALYSVEIYPVVFNVEGLKPAVYHYRASESILEAVREDVVPADVINAALPVERDMLAGAAALVCLTGCFPRHERKYGQGGYRMLVAEAGHISMNFVLAATALGISARPFGGVFDDLLNRQLGLDTDDEQFLLAVVVGNASS